MPCANRHFVPRLVWHITHRCHIFKTRLEWVEAGSRGHMARRDDRWSESIAVGSEGFVEQVKNEFGFQKHNIARFWWRTVCILA
jgi:hypothetical protein